MKEEADQNEKEEHDIAEATWWWDICSSSFFYDNAPSGPNSNCGNNSCLWGFSSGAKR